MNHTSTEAFASQMDWVGRNIAHNLSFIPDDKLNWKPAPTANSALEIINHLVPNILRLSDIISGGDGQFQVEPITTREAAQAAIHHAADEYSIQVSKLSPEELERPVQLPFGEVLCARACSIAVVEAINHHGQLTYIQTLLGDVESHIEL
ncbi:MAG TPA: DinB family protein [Abditibacteriaceae bacterium]|jgi:uncharacterized damage-inducible protein DinB|nr:DinB family protein [Abditibacteriaceae bacterium]